MDTRRLVEGECQPWRRKTTEFRAIDWHTCATCRTKTSASELFFGGGESFPRNGPSSLRAVPLGQALKGNVMLYRKNIGTTERWLRVAAGALIAICGLVVAGTSALGIVAACAGLITTATGIFGYCPACSIAGRRLAAASDRSRAGEG
jgi:Protein of unknown function (DUF2892)